jgi:hypothetical protein
MDTVIEYEQHWARVKQDREKEACREQIRQQQMWLKTGSKKDQERAHENIAYWTARLLEL